MRIGIYLGRHSGSAGALGVFARSLVVHLIAATSRDEAGTLEIVIYGDAVLLDSQFLERLSLLPQLIEPLDTIFTRGAGAFMRVLPNGARIRVVIRRLPTILGTAFGRLFDQVLVPLLAKRDRIDLLHSVSNIGISNAAISSILASTSAPLGYFQSGQLPQITTVHSLEKNWPKTIDISRLSRTDLFSQSRAEGSSNSPPKLNEVPLKGRDTRKGIKGFGITAALSRIQYRSSSKSVFVATAPSIEKDLVYKLGLSRESVSLIRPGIDEYFGRFNNRRTRLAEQNRELSREIDRLFGLTPGYVLHLCSSDPRKNSAASIRGWEEFAKSRPEHLVLVNAPRVIKVEGSDYVRLAGYFSGSDLESRVHLVPWVDRESMPLLLAGAAVLLAPSDNDELELAQFEALAVGTPVVVRTATDSAQPDPVWGRMVFQCAPQDMDSIAGALKLALGSKDHLQDVPSIRTMEQVARDYLNLYRDVLLKFGTRRPPV